MHIRKSTTLKLFYSTLVVFVFLGFFNSCQTAGPGPRETAPQKVQPVEAPRNIDKAVKENPRENLPLLIEYIRENSENESEMFRYAHDWVAQNVAYDVEALRGESRKVTDAYEVLQYGKSVCAGYSNTLQLLCDELGIECVTISGYGRGASFDPYREEQMDGPPSNHAWNAVRLLGQWYLVDVTWNSGYVRGGEFEPNFNHHYYKIPPRQFAYRHFPLEEKWQLLDEPLDFKSFIAQPLLRGRFFTYGFRLRGEYKKISVVEENEYELQFSGGKDMLMSARLVSSSDQGEDLQGY
jgi:transglutaminase/protease-like cytokinesis protein 3